MYTLVSNVSVVLNLSWGYAVAQLVDALRYKLAGSILDGVIVIFHLNNSSGRTMAFRSTQPLKEISTRNISWGVKTADV
jgi:hypothetical protein